MDKEEFLGEAGAAWDRCHRVMEEAPSGRALRVAEPVFRDEFLKLCGQVLQSAVQKRAEGRDFPPSV